MGCACTKPIVREDRLTSPKTKRHTVRFTEGLNVAQALNNTISAITELDVERRKKDHLRHLNQLHQQAAHAQAQTQSQEQQHQNEQQSVEQKQKHQQQQQHQQQSQHQHQQKSQHQHQQKSQHQHQQKHQQQHQQPHQQHQENQARVRERSNGLSGPLISQADPQSHSKRKEKKDVLKDIKSFETIRPRNLPRHHEGEQVAAGWPAWLTDEAREAVDGWVPRRADSFEKLDKIGQGTYSNVYKARDLDSKKIVALKKVRFDNLDRDSVRFMAREIVILRNLDHPNVIKLEGLVTSRMSCSLYLVFEYMEHDLAGLIASPEVSFSEQQVKCYLHQLLSGLEHCHSKHVLHRDIKGSNLLLDNNGTLKIADFGLATFFNPEKRQPLTSRVVTLWYRPPELLLGATEYDIGVDLWSTGCILAELLARKPIMPGRTEVEQLHKIFKLCGSPSEDFWKKSKLPHATIFKPQQPYKRCIAETFKDFPSSAILLLEKLLAIEPADRGTASNALKSEYFNTKPYACDPSSLPRYPPSKEMDAKLREEERRRQWKAAEKISRVDTQKRPTHRSRAIPAPEANAELQANVQRRRTSTAYPTHQNPNVKSKSEKFPPPHEDGAIGYVMQPAKPTRLAPGNLSHAFAELSRNAAPSALSSRSATMETNTWRKQPVIVDDVRMAPRRPGNRSSKSISVSQSQDLSQIILAEREALARGSHRERPTYRQRERESLSKTHRDLSYSKTNRESCLSKTSRHTNHVQNRKHVSESSEFSGHLRSTASIKDERPPL